MDYGVPNMSISTLHRGLWRTTGSLMRRFSLWTRASRRLRGLLCSDLDCCRGTAGDDGVLYSSIETLGEGVRGPPDFDSDFGRGTTGEYGFLVREF